MAVPKTLNIKQLVTDYFATVDIVMLAEVGSRMLWKKCRLFQYWAYVTALYVKQYAHRNV